MTTIKLYNLAKKQGIETHTVSCPKSKAITINIKNKKHIGFSRSVFKSEYDERLILAHEIGHALTMPIILILKTP